MMRKILLGFAFTALVSLVNAGESCHPTGKKSGVETTGLNSEIKGPSQKDYAKLFPEISEADLKSEIEKGSVVLIDANSSESYTSGHIPGAIHYDKSSKSFSGALPEDKNTLIVAYCGGPKCQAWCGAADLLETKGYKNLKHFKGGIKEWKSAGNKISKLSDKES